MHYFIKGEKVLAFENKEKLKKYFKCELEKKFELENPVFLKLKEANLREELSFIAKNFLNARYGEAFKWQGKSLKERERN